MPPIISIAGLEKRYASGLQALKRIDLEIQIAGQRHDFSFNPAPNLSQQFTWDGRDAYGSLLYGARTAHIVVSFVYGAAYQQPAQWANEFSDAVAKTIKSKTTSVPTGCGS